MYRSSGEVPRFDSLVALEGKFHFLPGTDKEPVIEIHMALMDSTTGSTCAKGTVRSNLLTPITLEKFRVFLEAAEADFGAVVFSNGATAPFGPLQVEGKVEQETGLPQNLPVRMPKGLGEG